jgi:2-polyprenyl-3-methyl-5-hydroxy-6-metoxy-1,4-benzoquinol methylase
MVVTNQPVTSVGSAPKLVECYYCGTNDSSPYAVENGFSLVKCLRCGLLYVNPRPNQEEIDEAVKYGMHGGEKTLSTTGWYHPERIAEYCTVLRDFFPSGPEGCWLDIGCGHGEFLQALKRVGNVHAFGVEPNTYKRSAAVERGLDVQFFDLSSHRKQYDVVSMLNVYSHLPNPIETLAEWKNLVRPGGMLLLQTGDTADLSADVHYRPLYLPDHLSFASAKIVCSILEKIGFEIKAVRKYPFVPVRAANIAKEVMKIVWPGKTSKLRYINSEKYRTDMYILATRSEQESQ